MPLSKVLPARVDTLEWEDVQDWLENLARLRGEGLFKVKGTGERPAGNIGFIAKCRYHVFSSAALISPYEGPYILRIDRLRL